jgi:DNA modification methylase
MNEATILVGDVRERLSHIANSSVQCCVTSPPYWGLRDYGHESQLGLEASPEAYVENIVQVFREVRRILKDDGVLWLNLGDSYGKNKQLVGIPWKVAFALQADGWWLRQDIIWSKPNPMPESVTDRCTKAHEYLFLLTKSPRYYFDNTAIKEPAIYAGDDRGTRKDSRRGTDMNSMSGVTGDHKNRRSVWSICPKPFKGAHFAVMPEALCEPPILATSKPDDLVLDPFTGSGTVAVVALRHNRNFIGVELNPQYAQIAENRIRQDAPMLNKVTVDFATPRS